MEDGRGFRDIVNCASKFIESGQSSAVLIGVQLLNNLVSEMNQNAESDMTRVIFMQRKLSASFRDSLLLPIFRLSLNLLRDADKNIQSLDMNDPAQRGAVSQSLQLAQACLTFDFIGTSAGTGCSVCDESSSGMDDLVVIQIPTSWRSIFIDSDTVEMFFRLYNTLPLDLSALVLSCLVQLASIRRSLFTNPERSTFLSHLVNGTKNILANQSSTLSNPDTYHEFCRLLSRLKCNYQLTELIVLDAYTDFIHLLTAFTTHSLQSLQQGNNSNSLHYLLALWQRLVASISYVQSPDAELLENAASQVSCAYIESCLNSVENYASCPMQVPIEVSKPPKNEEQTNWGHSSTFPIVSGSRPKPGERSTEDNGARNDTECPLDDSTTLQQQLEQFAVIGRCSYAKTCTLIVRSFDESAGSYEKALTMLDQQTTPDDNLLHVIRLSEHRLAWLVYMVGSLIGSRVNYTNADDDYDSELVCRVLQLMRLTTNRLSLSAQLTASLSSSANLSPVARTSAHKDIAHSPGASRLELATLNFFEQFRRMYVGEPVGRMSRVYQHLSEVLGISDELTVLSIFGTKILTNLKYWSSNEPILNRTLNLLSEISRGYSAMRKLVRLDDIQFILANHSEDNFPFLSCPPDSADIPSSLRSAHFRLRTTFYASISRLLMVDLGEDENQFLTFMAPLTRTANQLIVALLSGAPTVVDRGQLRCSVIGLARDLRGISYSLNTKAAYQMLLDWFYPTGFKMFIRALELWPLDSGVTVSVLKCIEEVVHNRNGRLLFDSTVPTGYLLFNEVSRALNTIGLHIIPNTRDIPKSTVYSVKLKPIMAALNALKVCLSGNFINFGVFSLFREDSLEKAMEMSVQLMLCVDEADVQEYPKVVQSFFSLLEYMVNDHMPFVASLGTSVLYHFLESIANNLTSLDTAVSENCCLCLDYILTHLFKLVQQEQHHHSLQNSGLLNGSDDSLRLVDLDQNAVLLNAGSANQPAGRLKQHGVSRYAVWSSRSAVAETNLMSLIKAGPSSNLGGPSGLTVLQRILVILLSSVAQEECRSQWSMSRPLLVLILLNHEYYLDLRRRVIASLPADRQDPITKLFDKLMEDVEPDITGKNRDKFTQNVSSFKHALGEFVKSSSSKDPSSTDQDGAGDISTTNVLSTEQPSSGEYLCLASAIVQAAGLTSLC
ncbi:unnamed protein product [Calicophoron daubneyi]|uniref:Exportin-7/Ran-binding protein 17 TPR repeats domain-containing protein n=1 Tax=Calicophoron daubneyi TaxID=300641 RepID=A0AAV2TH93_CALDB